MIIARDLINEQSLSIAAACKKANISRSTFYKYKDKIFQIGNDETRKAILSIKVLDVKGVLSSLIQLISNNNANIISINQANPISGVAFIFLTIDVKRMSCSLDELIAKAKTIEYIKTVSVIAYE